jgi:hypothetical protein
VLPVNAELSLADELARPSSGARWISYGSIGVLPGCAGVSPPKACRYSLRHLTACRGFGPARASNMRSSSRNDVEPASCSCGGCEKRMTDREIVVRKLGVLRDHLQRAQRRRPIEVVGRTSERARCLGPLRWRDCGVPRQGWRALGPGSLVRGAEPPRRGGVCERKRKPSLGSTRAS